MEERRRLGRKYEAIAPHDRFPEHFDTVGKGRSDEVHIRFASQPNRVWHRKPEEIIAAESQGLIRRVE